MIVDYRVYCSIYGLAFLAHAFSIALKPEHFWFAQKVVWAVVGVTAAVNFLDWLWS
jgi:hypothetical protein